MADMILVTDGTPETVALARWLRSERQGARIVETRGVGDMIRVLQTRHRARNERLVMLSTSSTLERSQGVIDGSSAVDAVGDWLDALSPFDQRILGPARITDAVAQQAVGYAEVLDLLRRIRPVAAGAAKRTAGQSAKARKPGRPPGSDPFRGVGFDVCITLLLAPQKAWSERALAAAADRSTTPVHRTLIEFARRGYIARTRGATRLLKPEVLRDDLAAQWRTRVANRPDAKRFVAKRPTELRNALRRAQRKSGAHLLLAEWSALQGPEASLNGPATVYAEANDKLLSCLSQEGFSPYEGRRADLVVWQAPERAIFTKPRKLDGDLATNEVVTFLDLAISSDPRGRLVAEQVWQHFMKRSAGDE